MSIIVLTSNSLLNFDIVSKHDILDVKYLNCIPPLTCKKYSKLSNMIVVLSTSEKSKLFHMFFVKANYLYRYPNMLLEPSRNSQMAVSVSVLNYIPVSGKILAHFDLEPIAVSGLLLLEHPS